MDELDSVLSRMMPVESSGNPMARSPKGALGLYQVMPATAAMYGVTDPRQLFDPQINRQVAKSYLGDLFNRYGGNMQLALAAYNAGPGNVDKGAIPHSTQNYIDRILGSLHGGVAEAAEAPPTPAASPASAGADPATLLAMKRAVGQAMQQWPRFQHLPLALTQGSGPGYSETYAPDEPSNPLPGKLNVQLRSPEALRNQARWPTDVALEAIHGLQGLGGDSQQGTDPIYQHMTDQFVQSMSNQQRAAAFQAYLRDLGLFGPDHRSYDQWLRDVQAQEYIRGGIFTDVIKNWAGPHGEGHYTPQQLQLLNQIQGYLKGAPAPVQ